MAESLTHRVLILARAGRPDGGALRRPGEPGSTVIEGEPAWGAAPITTDVENYPASGRHPRPEMMEIFKRQAARFGIPLLLDDATAV